jgi:signal transduction histidine kinase
MHETDRKATLTHPDPHRPAADAPDDSGEAQASPAALRAALRRRDALLAHLGHELRNPLAPIRNAVEILRLLGTDRDSPQAGRAMDLLERQTAVLVGRLDELQDASRILRGQVALERRTLELRDAIREAAERVRPLTRQRRQRLEVELPPAGLAVAADPGRLGQILHCLLIHAALRTQEGGDIAIAAEADSAQVAVRVSDNGPGIPPERMGELLEPYALAPGGDGQSGESGPGSELGLGLGLGVCRRLAELQGGGIESSSSWPGPGSALVLRLPRVAPAPVPARSG